MDSMLLEGLFAVLLSVLPMAVRMSDWRVPFWVT